MLQHLHDLYLAVQLKHHNNHKPLKDDNDEARVASPGSVYKEQDMKLCYKEVGHQFTKHIIHRKKNSSLKQKCHHKKHPKMVVVCAGSHNFSSVSSTSSDRQHRTSNGRWTFPSAMKLIYLLTAPTITTQLLVVNITSNIC